MTFSKNKIIILLVVLASINIFLIIINYILREEIKAKPYNQINLVSDSYYNGLKYRLFNALKYEGYDLVDNTLFDSLKLQKQVLCLRLTRFTCNTCSDSLFFSLTKKFTPAKLKKVCIIIDSSQELYVRTFKRLYNSYFENIITSIPNHKITPLDELHVPYFFVYSEEGIGRMFYIPEKDFPEETERYLEIIDSTLDN